MHDGVGGDGVDGAGRDDDGACLGGEVVESGNGAFRAEVEANYDVNLLENHVKNPRRLSGDVDVVDTIPCACAVGGDVSTWYGVMKSTLRTSRPKCHSARMGLCS